MTQQSTQFIFWTPPSGSAIGVGAERQPFVLPEIPLPLYAAKAKTEPPDAALIGESLYDYLRQFPDCSHNRDYAVLLRDAFPHYLADLASHALMLRGKDVAGPYLGRMITSLKIFALLEPDNLELVLQLGIACFDRALMFEELPQCRRYLLEAMTCLQRVCDADDSNLSAQSYLGQVDYLFGDYPGARRHWLRVAEGLPAGAESARLQQKLQQLEAGQLPQTSLVDALEAVGYAMLRAGDQDWPGARDCLELALANDWLLRDFESPQLHYLHGLCLRRTGQTEAATAAFTQALKLDPDFSPARDELDRVSSPGV